MKPRQPKTWDERYPLGPWYKQFSTSSCHRLYAIFTFFNKMSIISCVERNKLSDIADEQASGR